MGSTLNQLRHGWNMMKLYELNRNDQFTIDKLDLVFTLDHIDGMYSVCYDNLGRMHHIAAFQEVKPKRKVSRIDIIGQNGNDGDHYE